MSWKSNAFYFNEFRLQFRHGLWLAALVMASVWVSILRALSYEHKVMFMPLVLFLDVSFMAFLFTAALVFHEKAQNSFVALLVSPISIGQMMGVRAVAISILTTVFVFFIATFSSLGLYHHFYLFLASGLMSLFMSFFGWAASLTFKKITDFLVFFMLINAPLSLPILSLWPHLDHSLYWLAPTCGLFILFKKVFGFFVSPQMLVVAFVHASFWTLLFAIVALRQFKKRVMKS